MQQLEDETPKPSPVGEIVRYVIVLGLAGFIVYYSYFRTPVNYVDKLATGKTMGTHFAVKVHGFPDNKDWDEVVKDVHETLDAVDQAMSTFQPNSEVSRFNATDSTDWVAVSGEIAEVVQLAAEISQLTGGAFDITEGPLAGHTKLEVRTEEPALKKSVPDLVIDLSAIARGYAVDRVAKALDARGIDNYMVEVGDVVRCKGNKGEENEWLIGIKSPIRGVQTRDNFPGVQVELHLGNRSLATSSALSDSVDTAECLGSASVIAPTCVQAGAWATAMCALGEKRGLELAEEQGIAVLFLFFGEEEESLREAASEMWTNVLEESTESTGAAGWKTFWKFF